MRTKNGHRPNPTAGREAKPQRRPDSRQGRGFSLDHASEPLRYFFSCRSKEVEQGFFLFTHNVHRVGMVARTAGPMVS